MIPVLTAIPRPQYVFGTISPKPTLKNVIAISHIAFSRFACSSSWNLHEAQLHGIAGGGWKGDTGSPELTILSLAMSFNGRGGTMITNNVLCFFFLLQNYILQVVCCFFVCFGGGGGEVRCCIWWWQLIGRHIVDWVHGYVFLFLFRFFFFNITHTFIIFLQ